MRLQTRLLLKMRVRIVKVEHKNAAGHLQPDSPENVDLINQIQIQGGSIMTGTVCV